MLTLLCQSLFNQVDLSSIWSIKSFVKTYKKFHYSHPARFAFMTNETKADPKMETFSDHCKLLPHNRNITWVYSLSIFRFQHKTILPRCNLTRNAITIPMIWKSISDDILKHDISILIKN